MSQSYKNRERSLLIADIRNSVNVTAINGAMYIVCKGVVVQKLENENSVAHVLNEIENIIEARFDYEGINHDSH